MPRHIAYLMQTGTEGLPTTYSNTPQNHRRKAHMKVYTVGVGIVTQEINFGIQLDGTIERETRRVSGTTTVLDIFNQAQSKVKRPTFKRVPITARVEDITEEQYQSIQSLK
tara:strand:- start:2359 stop:2691 length:333 start_codon:yes stop_codon:yes gene_type:complete